MKQKDVLDDPKWERDITVIFCKYLKSSAIWDILANVPVMIYYFQYGFSYTEEEIEASLGTSTFLGFIQLCKFLRLLHIVTLFNTMRFFFDKLGDYFF